MKIKKFSAKEYYLLAVARALVAADHSRAAEFVSHRELTSPKKLSPSAMALFRQTLAIGSIRQLLLRGGWRQEVFLGASANPVNGRLWQRHPKLPPLHFSAASFHVCQWFVQPNLTLPSEQTLYSGDEIIHFLACEMACNFQLEVTFAGVPTTQRSVLSWLAFPHLLAAAGPCPLTRDDFVRFLDETGCIILEALTHDLAHRWVVSEREKTLLSSQALHHLGQTQETLLTHFLDTLEALQRHDLATFLIQAASQVLSQNIPVRKLANSFRGKLKSEDSLQQRSQAQHAAGAFLRAIGRINQWYEQFRYAHIFDDNYHTAQALLRRWESFGSAGFHRAALVASELESIDGMVTSAEESQS